MAPSLVLDTVTRLAFHTVGAFSLYLLFAGHNAPGGGFVGGLVAGSALVLRYAAHGTQGVRDVLALRPETLLGLGLLLAALTATVPWLFGGELLQSASWERDLPLLGHVKIVSVLFFDGGVYLIVVGLVLGALVTLGAERGRP